MSSTPRNSTLHSLDSLLPILDRTETDRRPVVLMTCGIAGSGKTTLTKSVIRSRPNLNRLSMDEIIFEKHGLYDVDYPADDSVYHAFLDEADKVYMARLRRLLGERKDVMVEKSFWAREERDEYKKVVEENGGRWVLVHLPEEEEVLWHRICERNIKDKDANSALHISRDLFESYWTGFEHPEGEGEIVLKVQDVSEAKRSTSITGKPDPC